MNLVRYVGACIFMSRESYKPECFNLTINEDYGKLKEIAIKANPFAAECLEVVDYAFLFTLLAGMLCATMNIMTINITKQRNRNYNLHNGGLKAPKINIFGKNWFFGAAVV